MAERLIPLQDVIAQTGIMRTNIYARIARGTFPAPIKIGTASRWQESKIQEWVAQQVAASESSAA